jgi:hypothetical protein
VLSFSLFVLVVSVLQRLHNLILWLHISSTCACTKKLRSIIIELFCSFVDFVPWYITCSSMPNCPLQYLKFSNHTLYTKEMGTREHLVHCYNEWTMTHEATSYPATETWISPCLCVIYLSCRSTSWIQFLLSKIFIRLWIGTSFLTYTHIILMRATCSSCSRCLAETSSEKMEPWETHGLFVSRWWKQRWLNPFVT